MKKVSINPVKKELPEAFSWLRRLARSRAFKLVTLGANIVAPIIVLSLMYLGARSVQQSHEQVEVAQAARDAALGQLDGAITARKNAENTKAGIEADIIELRRAKERVEAENRKLLAEADPKAVIARVLRELGGQTPRIRSDSLYKQGRDAYAAGNITLACELYLAARDEEPDYIWPYVGLGRGVRQAGARPGSKP